METKGHHHLFLARDLISNDVPPIKTSDTGTRAMQWMADFRVSHLPIVNHQEFLGLISESDILDLNHPDEPIGNHSLSLAKPYILEDQHFYDVLKVITSLKLSILPVLDRDGNYLGLITLSTMLAELAAMGSMKENGGLIVLELNVHDYHLSEIARIVESNDAKILSLYISSPVYAQKIEVTIKVNRTDLSGILQTFHRFNYTVKASFHDGEEDQGMLDRYQSFLKFLEP